MKKKSLLTLSFFAMSIIPLHNANAIFLKGNDKEFANIGVKLAIWAQDNGKVTTNDQNSTNFSVENTRLYFSGQINPVVQFGSNIDFTEHNGENVDGSARAHTGMPSTLIKDAFINLKFSPRIQLMAGMFLDPWSRVTLVDLYSFIIPLEAYNPGVSEINVDGGNLLKSNSQINQNYSCQNNVCKFKPFINPLVPFTFGSDVGNAYRDIGIALWGDIGKNAMIKYYFMIGNGKFDYQSKYNGKSNLKYGFRIEFTPTMFGYKGDPNYVDEDTFFGKRNTLTFAFAYQQQKVDCSGSFSSPPGMNVQCPTPQSSTTAKAYTFDILWEQKFGDFVPNLQAAWLLQKDLGYATAGSTVAKPQAQGYYLQTQLLYNKYIGIGKPALVLRYEQDENKNYYVNPDNPDSFITGKIDMTNIFFNYYIDSENANVSLGAQIVSPDANLEDATANGSNQLKPFTDYTLALRTVF